MGQSRPAHASKISAQTDLDSESGQFDSSVYVDYVDPRA